MTEQELDTMRATLINQYRPTRIVRVATELAYGVGTGLLIAAMIVGLTILANGAEGIIHP